MLTLAISRRFAPVLDTNRHVNNAMHSENTVDKANILFTNHLITSVFCLVLDLFVFLQDCDTDNQQQLFFFFKEISISFSGFI
jgi:hypothetical protein